MARITIASLQARIAELEAVIADQNQRLETARTLFAEQRRELNAYQVMQRPSRREEPSDKPAAAGLPEPKRVVMGGKPHMKCCALVNGRKVFTYRPIKEEAPVAPAAEEQQS